MFSLNAIASQIGSISGACLAEFIIPVFGWGVLYLFGLLPFVVMLCLQFSKKEILKSWPGERRVLRKTLCIWFVCQFAPNTVHECLLVHGYRANYRLFRFDELAAFYLSRISRFWMSTQLGWLFRYADWLDNGSIAFVDGYGFLFVLYVASYVVR